MPQRTGLAPPTHTGWSLGNAHTDRPHSGNPDAGGKPAHTPHPAPKACSASAASPNTGPLGGLAALPIQRPANLSHGAPCGQRAPTGKWAWGTMQCGMAANGVRGHSSATQPPRCRWPTPASTRDRTAYAGETDSLNGGPLRTKRRKAVSALALWWLTFCPTEGYLGGAGGASPTLHPERPLCRGMKPFSSRQAALRKACSTLDLECGRDHRGRCSALVHGAFVGGRGGHPTVTRRQHCRCHP